MRAFLDPRQYAHYPTDIRSSGAPGGNPEKPERIDALKAGAEAAGLTIEAPTRCGMAPLAAVHSPQYLDFLRTIHARWSAMPDARPEVIAIEHPKSPPVTYPASPIGQAGLHMADASCAITADTWASAHGAASGAVAAARAVLERADAAYALCRPPGHHAERASASGFCYLNNSAIAAQLLRDSGTRPAILDVDLHHGNGTQAIFYRRDDVLTVSIHAETSAFYPFYWGYADEHGEGPGEGCNLNLPLVTGAGDAVFLEALEAAVARIRVFGADALVLALGLDAFAGDPFARLSVSTEGFRRIAARCGALGLPTVLVQEGGYLCPELGGNLTAFLDGFQQERASA